MADVNPAGFYQRLAEEQRRENGGQYNVREPPYADDTTLLKLACLALLFITCALVNCVSVIWRQHRLNQRVRDLDREYDRLAADFEDPSGYVDPPTNDKVEKDHEHEHTD